MKPNKLTRLVVEDYLKYEGKDWIAPLFKQINDHQESINGILDKGIGIIDNCNAEYRDIVFKTKAVVSDTFPVSVKSNVGNPKAVWVGKAVVGTGVNEKPTIAPQISWVYDGGQIKILDASGLEVSMDYKLTLVVIAA